MRTSPASSPHRPRRLSTALAVLSVAACGGSTTEVVNDDPVATSITVAEPMVVLDFLGQVQQLSATVLDQAGGVFSAPVTWGSADESVATVSATGRLVAVGNGSTEVTATSGDLQADVQVTVEQAAFEIVIVSGDAQDAVAGTPVPDALVALVRDRGGAGVADVAVTFETADGGSFGTGAVQTASDGLATTSWTLGPEFGHQGASAIFGGGAVDFEAFARDVVPRPDLTTNGTLTVTRPDPTSLETVTVGTTIRNDGDGGTTVGYRVQVLSDGVEVASTDRSALDAGAQETLEITVGPLAAGGPLLSFVVDADGDVAELIEINNEVEQLVDIRLQTPVEESVTVSDLSAVPDEEILFRLDVPPGAASTLNVTLTGGTGDADLFVEGGTRPSLRGDYDDCVSAGPTADESCQLVSASGTYHILVHGWEGGPGFSGTALDISFSGQVLPYDIDLVFIDNGTPTQDDAVRDAAARWRSIIVADVPDIDFTANTIPADDCVEGQPQISDVIDDVRIFVKIIDIDGPFGTLAQAGPCLRRANTELTVIGVVQFDEADLERLESDGDMLPVILHEMGHVLGIGTNWPERGLLENPSLPDNQGADTHFSGARARAAFDAAGGDGYVGAKVPVENMAGEGSGDAHWRESVLASEVMTPSLNGGITNPLSAITIESLGDLGYTVDPAQADPYSLPLLAPPSVTQSRGVLIDLRGDIWSGPRAYVDERGRIVGRLR